MIPYLDLKAQYQSLKPEFDATVISVLGSGQYVLGKEVGAFEEEFAAYCQSRHAIGVNTGTSALHLALLAAGIQPGDEVITVPNTFVATVAAILYTGAKPVFVDVQPETLNIDPSLIEKAITKRTKVLLPVHLYGQCADMDPILDIAQKHGLKVIEDAAQAHGAEYKGRRAGSMGVLGCFSFYPGKNLGAFGEGGAITTQDPVLAKNVRMLRDWGAEKKYHHDLKGFNYRMDAIQGAILRVKLRRLEAWTEARRALAQQYDNELQDSNVTFPGASYSHRHVYHVYAIRTERRDDLIQFLSQQEIQTNIHYPIPVHLQKAYSDLGYKSGNFPIAESLCQNVLSLPLFPELKPDQVSVVTKAVKMGLSKFNA
jgi:dTDP-4-amino-4,6-dideoxygalactose transaminase